MGKSSSKPPEKSIRIRCKTVVPKSEETSANESSSTSSKTLKRPARRSGDATPSSSQPPAKKNRMEVNGTPRIESRRQTISSETGEEDNTRRRRTLKHGEIASPQCTFCKEEQKPEDETLKECSECKAKYHLQKCLRYKKELSNNIRKNENWRCARCILCTACGCFIDDPANVECTACCRAWHGFCAPRGHCPLEEFDSDWYCSHCCRKLKFEVLRTPPNPHSAPTTTLRRKLQKASDQLEFVGNIEELKDLINKRDYTWELLNYEAGFSSNKPEVPVLSTSAKSKSKKEKKRKAGDSEDEEFDYTSNQKEAHIPNVVRSDVILFEESKAEAYSSQPSSSAHPEGQWLQFGTGKSCKAIYNSAFNEPLYSAPNLYACKFCLHTTHVKEDLIAHWSNCNVKHPPGNEIYRHEGVSFFEVDGANQKKYCQNLCLIAKLFIASKTLYDEVETFTFYILCEITSEGFIIVGYFSKEKNPSKNNNLSCLLVLPMVQKMGYGRLLIDMSYELSRLEHRIGHPEHPISDLGILAYRGYWRSSLLCYLRKHRDSDRLNIKDICLTTRIAPIDIVNQLMVDNMIVLKGGVYSIKIGKRALKFPLSQSRRRFVEPSKLVWRPKPSANQLDPTKINTYV